MSTLIVKLQDAPNKMTAETVQGVEQKFAKVLEGEFRSTEAMNLSYKAYMTAMDGDGIALSKDMQSKAEGFHKAYTKATQVALSGRWPKEDTRFDVKILP
ncbi:hypothetical protein [Comamonas sp.]|uniref:hypothetical protein n=1 Tax=Comamonas sp. TaxID=34028 RepID=UPI0028993ABE|nr:hypothetical protein [Comamonas sp.]